MRASTSTHTSTAAMRYPSGPPLNNIACLGWKSLRTSSKDEGGSNQRVPNIKTQDLLHPRDTTMSKDRGLRSIGFMIPLHHASPVAINGAVPILSSNPIRSRKKTPNPCFTPLRGERRDSHSWDRGPSKGRRRKGKVSQPEEERLSAPPVKGLGRNSGPAALTGGFIVW